MHRRKTFLIYPPNYDYTIHRYKKAKSMRQAKKIAYKMGPGAEIDVGIRVHDKKHHMWNSYCAEFVGAVQ